MYKRSRIRWPCAFVSTGTRTSSAYYNLCTVVDQPVYSVSIINASCTCTAARRDGALRTASRTTRHVEVVKKKIHTALFPNRLTDFYYYYFLLQQPVGCETPIRGVCIWTAATSHIIIILYTNVMLQQLNNTYKL